MEIYWILSLVFISASIRKGEARLNQLLIDCGSNSSLTVDGREWVGDFVAANNFTLTSPGIIASSETTDRESSYGALYKIARIFNTTSIYNFSIAAGSYYVRLHFYPF